MFERTLVWLIAIALAIGASPASAQDATPAAPSAPAAPTEDTYVDPAGRFTVPIPPNWTAATRDGYGVLADPEHRITVYALTVDWDDPVAAVAAAWRVVDPAFARQPIAVQEPPPRPASSGSRSSPTTSASRAAASSRASPKPPAASPTSSSSTPTS